MWKTIGKEKNGMDYHFGVFGRLLCVFATPDKKNVRIVCVNQSGRRFVFLCPLGVEIPPYPAVIEFSATVRWAGTVKGDLLAYCSDFSWQEYKAR
jgi:hypothetical protein